MFPVELARSRRCPIFATRFGVYGALDDSQRRLTLLE